MSLLNVSESFTSRSDAESVDPSIVRLFVSEITTNQYFTTALMTALVYNSIITFDKEVKYFWPSPRSSISIIYFANRYIGLFGTICSILRLSFTESLSKCLFAHWGAGLTNLVNIVLIDYILLIRVLAFFDGDKKVSVILKLLLGLEASIGLCLLIYSNLFEGIAVSSLSERLTTCGLRRFPPRVLAIISWLVPMAYGLILLCLVLYKAAEYWKLSSGFKGLHLVRVLVRDQLLYYGFVIFCSLSQTVGNVIGTSPFAANVLEAAGSPTLLCILGGQLLINLKEAGERGANGGTNYTPRSVSDIDFGQNDAPNEGSAEGEAPV